MFTTMKLMYLKSIETSYNIDTTFSFFFNYISKTSYRDMTCIEGRNKTLVKCSNIRVSIHRYAYIDMHISHQRLNIRQKENNQTWRRSFDRSKSKAHQDKDYFFNIELYLFLDIILTQPNKIFHIRCYIVNICQIAMYYSDNKPE